MAQTLATRRARIFDIRAYQVNRLTLLRLERRQICGCTRCGDESRGAELDALIAATTEQVTRYTNQICEQEP